MGTKITNRGTVLLARLRGLKYLQLSETAVDNGAVASLGRLVNLRELQLFGTKISAAGIKQLQCKLASTPIYWTDDERYHSSMLFNLRTTLVESHDPAYTLQIRIEVDRWSWEAEEALGPLYRYCGERPALSVHIRAEPGEEPRVLDCGVCDFQLSNVVAPQEEDVLLNRWVFEPGFHHLPRARIGSA